MAEKSKSLLSIGAALASLSGLAVQGAEAKATVVNGGSDTQAKQALNSTKLIANAHFQAGEDLLGFVMTKQAEESALHTDTKDAGADPAAAQTAAPAAGPATAEAATTARAATAATATQAAAARPAVAPAH